MPQRRISLRMRLTLWFVVIFTLIYIGVLGGMWVLHHDLSQRALYQRLTGLAEGVAMNMTEADAVVAPGTLHRFQPIDRRHSILAVRDDAGNVLVSRYGVDTNALPAIKSPSPVPNEPTLHSFEGEAARQLLGREISGLMVTYRFTRPDGQVMYLDLARTIDVDEQDQFFLFDAFVVGALCAMIAAVVAAWLIAGRAVAPITQFADAARGVDAEHFDTRLQVESTDHEVARLQTELNNALTRLEEGYRSQERFISHAAHDLKTPIAVMLTEAQVLNPDTASAEDVKTYQKNVVREMRRLGNLVEGFLTLARADQGEVLARRTHISLNDLVLDCVSHCVPQARLQNVRLVPHLVDVDSEHNGQTLYADPDLLCTMIENLTRNAIRFAPPESVVDITVLSDDENWRVTVRDHGPGVPEDYHEKVFERYFVVEKNSDPKSSGVGLGLSIAQGVAQLHGGSIKLSNAEGGGCLCTVTLPKDHDAQAEADITPDGNTD